MAYDALRSQPKYDGTIVKVRVDRGPPGRVTG
jgi:hypothetical protein